MSANDEITLEDLAKKDNKGQNKNSKFGNKKGRVADKVNGVKKGIRRTGNYQKGNNKNNSRRTNTNNQNNQSVRTIPQHKKRIVKVYNLAPEITNEDFYALFVKYGMIEKASIDMDQKGKSQEKGTVVYREHDAAQRAIDDLNGVELEQRIITVEFMKDGETLNGKSKNRLDGNVAVLKRGIFKRNNNNNSFRKNSNGTNNNDNNRKFKRRLGFQKNNNNNGNRKFRNNRNNRNNN
ncbi:polyadenylate-binding protein, putative [Ichthyophthirius multifiliis]|uniref:Polyadenylate-binding protein, putative n=1 Tax=Ichthyophthirius multifiliis TaxID=5932 RepID=G0QN26_ICHMU|nr:polyadenylate-binding protein, putative [Ichthyophthirius multifiliis]EGR33379.1 polyadenylate-binding protein, putative [Ichthyophthirius multifiliis]|eukprot:XP_004037365.1 polyadenylate-binding protein, putative [Ichthyophthirius multifiliis]